jgi:cell fate regulator YaaT (PSP1 superfamily)
VFKTRIELRQIGVRDEARVVGGLGICGRALCCNSITDKLRPVSIKMAKEQNQPLNPNKISGQ